MVLVLILGLLLLLARFARRFQGGGGSASRSSGRVEVVARRSLGKHSALVVIKVAGRYFLVGQSAHQMTMLTELDGGELSDSSSTSHRGVSELGLSPGTALGGGDASPGAWDVFLDRLRELTVRR